MLNKTITVKISNLPKSMQKHAVPLANVVRCPQLSIGPIDPNPGPILPIDDADALKDVIKSRPVEEKIIEANTNIKI